MGGLHDDVTEEKCWGEGLLMFCSFRRNEIDHNLKSHHLPQLEVKTKLKKCGVSDTKFTRTTVCKY